MKTKILFLLLLTTARFKQRIAVAMPRPGSILIYRYACFCREKVRTFE